MVLNPFGFYKYISPSQENDIRNFKYKGGSDSITYEYIWSPMTHYIVTNWIPEWMAPNLITLISFIIIWISHFVMLYCSQDFETPLSRGVMLFAGLCTLAYQTLDNMDGKQARRTGSSSALGMIFDHNGDSITVWVLAINFSILMGAGFSKLSFIKFSNKYECPVIGGLSTFYSAHWLQNQLGVFRLGRINAVDEGFLLAFFYYFFSSYMGFEFFQQEIYAGHNLGEVMLALATALSIFQNIDFWQYVLRKSKFPLHKIIINQIPQLLLLITLYVLLEHSAQQVHAKFTIYYITVALGFSQSKLTLHLQISNIGDNLGQTCHMPKTYLIANLGFIINTLSSKFNNGESYFDENKFAIVMMVFTTYAYFHTAVCVIIQMCDILNIKPFKLKPKTK